MRRAGAGIALWLFSALAHGAPLVAIIVDDLGDNLELGRRAIALPAPVTCSFLPKTPFARSLAALANERGKEVMLHLPMEAVEGPEPGPGAITLPMTEGEFAGTFVENLDSVPHVRGVNNHMGSLITRHPGHMAWLMDRIRERDGMYFVDSRTTPHSIAQRIAWERGVPTTRRNIFLDYARDRERIRRQFRQLIRLARDQGSAVGIGHPHPETLEVLEQMLPAAEANGVRFVPVSELISVQQRRSDLWQVSWYPSRKGAKNSKP